MEALPDFEADFATGVGFLLWFSMPSASGTTWISCRAPTRHRRTRTRSGSGLIDAGDQRAVELDVVGADGGQLGDPRLADAEVVERERDVLVAEQGAELHQRVDVRQRRLVNFQRELLERRQLPHLDDPLVQVAADSSTGCVLMNRCGNWSATLHAPIALMRIRWLMSASIPRCEAAPKIAAGVSSPSNRLRARASNAMISPVDQVDDRLVDGRGSPGSAAGA